LCIIQNEQGAYEQILLQEAEKKIKQSANMEENTGEEGGGGGEVAAAGQGGSLDGTEEEKSVV